MRNKYQIDGDVTTIFLTRRDGQVMETIIDTADFEKADSFPYTWYAHYDPSAKNFYVKGTQTVGKRQKTVSFHRWLLNVEGKLKVDHFNHDTLDNRTSCNLRVVTNAQNLQNRKGAATGNISGVRNVAWHKTKKKWQAQININGKQVYLGRFDDINEAEAVVKAVRAQHLPYSSDAVKVV